MSTAVLPAPVLARRVARPGLGRLTLVELRKMSDTRAGFWLLATTALLTVAAAVIAGARLPSDGRQPRQLPRDQPVPAERPAARRRASCS